ncbi:MAG: type II toxin-antitoxin system PemK/MazF family toxin [Pyrinomonadaceae bacterium]|nr:type II toxin-antitoxin system PemK/MazF family toxin [Pyrinomonadaceae bacterium]
MKRFEIYLYNLDNVPASEAKNTRPCVVVSPDEINGNLASVIVAPIASAGPSCPTRIPFAFLGENRAVVVDQVRTVDKDRLVKKIGVLKGRTKNRVLRILREMFAD